MVEKIFPHSPGYIKPFLQLFLSCLFYVVDKSEKLVAKRNKILNLRSLFIYWETQFLILANWIIESDLF